MYHLYRRHKNRVMRWPFYFLNFNFEFENLNLKWTKWSNIWKFWLWNIYSIYHLKIQAKYILEIQRFKKIYLHVDTQSMHLDRIVGKPSIAFWFLTLIMYIPLWELWDTHFTTVGISFLGDIPSKRHFILKYIINILTQTRKSC